MSEDCEEEQSASSLNPTDDGGYKIRPPSKKKYEEDMDRLVGQIREREGELEKMKSGGSMNIIGELRNLKVEKSAAITKRKQIDTELEKLKKILPEKMHQLGQLESSLIYKSEEKINASIQRLEWNLKVQPFKLMEEKRIVSEIDRLRRSKKTLVQYLALKQDISAIRDIQRGMREERDTYFQAVGKLNTDEDKLRRNCTTAKTSFSVLKSEIDELYESKRQLVASYKKQVEEYQGARDKQRKGSWRKREDFRKSAFTDRKKQQAELEIEKTPFEKYISWCNSLIKVLSRYSSLALQEPSLDSLSPASSMEEPELAEEIDDGQYILLKKNDDGLEISVGARRPSKKNRRPRKQSSTKKVTLSPDMVQQLSELGLKAPNSVAEVSEAIESLRLKKVLLEQEQQSSEVASDAGISATESQICEMSRQASKTESCEGAVDTNPGEHVYDEILHRSMEERPDHPKCWEVDGAVGGCEDQSEILSPNSDSTVEGDTGSSESQSSVFKNPDSSTHDFNTPDVIIYPADGEEGSREGIQIEQFEHSVGKNLDLLSAKKQMKMLSEQHQVRSGPSNIECLQRRGRSLENVNYTFPPENERDLLRRDEVRCVEKPTVLCTPPVSFQGKHQAMSSASSLDFPSLTTTSIVTSNLSQCGNKSVWNCPADPLRSTRQIIHSALTPSPTQQPHCTLAARLSNPSTVAGRAGQVQPTLTVPTQPTALILDNEDFPSLSQTVRQPRRGSAMSTKSSGGSSAHQEQLLPSCDHHPTTPSANQITNPDISGQSQPQTVFPSHQMNQPQTSPMSDELLDSHLSLQKCTSPHVHSDKLISMSQIPSMDKSSTEKWVESSVAYVKEFLPDQCEDNVAAVISESTRL